MRLFDHDKVNLLRITKETGGNMQIGSKNINAVSSFEFIPVTHETVRYGG